MPGGGVTGQDDGSTFACRPEHIARRDDAPVCERHARASLEDSALAPRRDTEAVRDLDIEATRSFVLDECVADRGNAVFDGEGLDAIADAVEAVPRPDLDRCDRVRQTSEDAT